MAICASCYREGLRTFVNRRRHRISEVTAQTYWGDGRRFVNFFIEGGIKVKGSWQSTSPRGTDACLTISDMSEFLKALTAGGMAHSSATVYRTPIEGAFNYAPACDHC